MKRGLTLVELLVIMALAGLIAGAVILLSRGARAAGEHQQKKVEGRWSRELRALGAE